MFFTKFCSYSDEQEKASAKGAQQNYERELKESLPHTNAQKFAK